MSVFISSSTTSLWSRYVFHKHFTYSTKDWVLLHASCFSCKMLARSAYGWTSNPVFGYFTNRVLKQANMFLYLIKIQEVTQRSVSFMMIIYGRHTRENLDHEWMPVVSEWPDISALTSLANISICHWFNMQKMRNELDKRPACLLKVMGVIWNSTRFISGPNPVVLDTTAATCSRGDGSFISSGCANRDWLSQRATPAKQPIPPPFF